MKPVRLKDAFKQFTADQDKVLHPSETVRRFRERLERLNLHILEETVRIDNGRLDIPVFFSRCGRDARRVIGTRKQMGKGATPEQAEASAVMELAERFSFFSFCRDERHFITATHHRLADRAISFGEIARSVHDTSDDLAVTRTLFEHLPMKWTEAYHISDQRMVLVPFDWFYAINEFNGPSAGNCAEEAISQGICEIIERHVSAMISRDRRRVPAIAPQSATDDAVRNMLDKYRAAGISLTLSDFSLDTGIPSVGVLAWDPSTHPHHSEIVWTAGTTPDPEKSLSRTLTEVAQLAGDFNTRSNFVASGLPKFNDIQEAEFITQPDTTIDLKDLPDLSHANIRVEVENLVQAVSRMKMNIYLIDTMHPLLEVPAFYTIIPGAHFRERATGTSVGMFSCKLITEKYPPEEAIRRLSDFDHRLPDRYYIKFYQGFCLVQLNRHEEALTLFRGALELAPPPQEAVSIYSYMGVCLKEMARYTEALDVLDKGCALDAERTDIHNLMGFCHFKLKAHEAAIEAFKRVVALDPGSAIDYANIATNYRELGDVNKAVSYYETALALDPTIEFAAQNLAALRQRSTRH